MPNIYFLGGKLFLYSSFVGVFLGIFALVFGIVALFKISKSPKLYSGRGKAIAGIVLGALLVFIDAFFTMAIFFISRMGRTF
ncbi:DUF4190 domain-containing protein [Candidatus Woesearchaeota archaeon]|nr:DUF4190 domain-containing protein [Candidatus Woesearchaeota archaeon]